MFLKEADFPAFTAALEANWPAVLRELRRLPRESFVPWHETHLYTNSWKVYGLYSFGRKLKDHCAQCPETAALLEKIPNLVTAGFSMLLPGTHIKPHKGYSGSVLRCHLGLVTPEECALTVAGTTRRWEAGKCLVFDDTSLHEAWNRSGQERTVLLVDYKKDGKDFSLLEKMKMTALFFWAKGRERLLRV